MNIFNPPPPSDATATSVQPPVTLLTLPRSDLAGSSNDASAPSSLLLQLPLHWTVDDFIHHHSSNEEPKTYFVSSRHESSKQVACVVENKGASFMVHRVETSNVLILVPPGTNVEAINTDDITADDNSDVKTDQQHRTTIAQHLPAQLLKTGGSGASFLELRPQRLRRADVRGALRTYDPSSTATHATPWIGRTVRDLARSLQVSQWEVRRGLTQIQAFPVPRTDPTQFVLVADSMLQDCYHAVIDGLILFGPTSEDYAGVGIKEAASFVDFVVQKVFSDDEQCPDLDCLIHHCLRFLQTTCSEEDPEATSWSSPSNQQRYILDVAKVARVTARRLFLKNPEPWNEVDFFTAWQSELPGKGAQYQVRRTMLRGVAVHTGHHLSDKDDFENTVLNSERLWHFLPVESISTDPIQCFATLFALKERWCMYELEPYLDHLVEASSATTTSAELLLRYSKLIREDHDGVARTFYQTK